MKVGLEQSDIMLRTGDWTFYPNSNIYMVNGKTVSAMIWACKAISDCGIIKNATSDGGNKNWGAGKGANNRSSSSRKRIHDGTLKEDACQHR